MDESLINADVVAADEARPVLSHLFGIGWAVALQLFVQLSSGLVGFVVIGRYEDEEVEAAFGLGNTLCNLCGRFILLGLGAGLDTLASQAWGAKAYTQVGLYGLRALLILLVLACAPLSAVWWYSSPILVALHQNGTIADHTAVYARVSLPGLYAMALYVVLSKLFLAMGKSRPVMLTALLSELTLILLMVLLIAHYRLGLLGAALSVSAANVLQAGALCVLAARDADMRRCWPGPTRDCLRVVELHEAWSAACFSPRPCRGTRLLYGGSATPRPARTMIPRRPSSLRKGCYRAQWPCATASRWP